MKHLEEFLQDVVDKGGEGIILRDPFIPLQAGRSMGYLKHKVSAICLTLPINILFLRNSEMLRLAWWRLMGRTSGNVKCKGEAFQSLWQLTHNFYYRPNGVRFLATAGSAEFARRYNVNVGDIVSFKHRGFLLATKKPKFPSLYRVRSDLEWDDVVNNWKEMKTIRSYGIILPSLADEDFLA